MKVLVIGGTGNIGSAVVEALLERGHDVFAIGRGLEPLHETPAGAAAIALDRDDGDAMRIVAQRERFDAVIDLAAQTTAHAEQDFALFRDCGHVLIASSVAVYGIAPAWQMPIREDIPLRPNRPYGKNKKAIEDYALMQYHACGWPATIMRPAFTYGRQRAIFRQISQENLWIDRICKGKPIVTGNPQVVRNFLHVRDAALGFALTMENTRDTVGQAYNLVGGYTTSWGEWHEAVMDALGRRVECVEVPYETMEALGMPSLALYRDSWRYNGFYSGDKLRRDMSAFCQRVSVREGVALQLDYIARHHLEQNSDDVDWEDALIRAQCATRVTSA